MGECLVGQWIVGVISFQKIFGLYGLERHIVEKRWGVTLVHGQRKCEDGARILKQNSQNGATHPWQQTTVPPLRVILLLLSSPPHLQHIGQLLWVEFGLGEVSSPPATYHLQLSNPDSNLSKDSMSDFSRLFQPCRKYPAEVTTGPPFGGWRPSGEQLDKNGQLS